MKRVANKLLLLLLLLLFGVGSGNRRFFLSEALVSGQSSQLFDAVAGSPVATTAKPSTDTAVKLSADTITKAPAGVVTKASATKRDQLSLETRIHNLRSQLENNPVNIRLIRELALALQLQRQQQRRSLEALLQGLRAFVHDQYDEAYHRLLQVGRSRKVSEMAQDALSVSLEEIIAYCRKHVAQDVCKLCGGTRRADCRACMGLGWRRCPACKGNGYIRQADRLRHEMYTITCPTCRGRGLIKCKTCKGSGTIPCPECANKATPENPLLNNKLKQEIARLTDSAKYLLLIESVIAVNLAI